MPKRTTLRRIDQQITVITTAAATATAGGGSEPDTLTVASTNQTSGGKHTHAITTDSAPGVSSAILATDADGDLTIGGEMTAYQITTEFGDISDTLLATTGNISMLNVGTTSAAGTGAIRYNNNLQPFRNGTYYTGYTIVPRLTPLSSTSWDGDSKDEFSTGTIDLQAAFSAPASIQGVFVSVDARGATVGDSIAFGRTLATAQAVILRLQVANQWIATSGFVPCDSSGDIAVNVVSSTGIEVYLKIPAYVI